MECLAEMPRAPLADRRPRKRQRLGWDVGPEMHQVWPPRSGRPASISPRGSVDLVRVIIITACCVVFLVYYVDLGRLGR